jgi:hypothetical protein
VKGSAQLTSILDALLAEGVEFVLVGGLAAVAQGAPITTHDVDIVHARSEANLDRLMAVLGKLNAHYRGRSVGSVILPDRRALAMTGYSLLTTDLGPLDCLGAIEEGRDYEDLIPLSVEVDLDGRRLRVLRLDTIVAIKQTSTEAKTV